MEENDKKQEQPEQAPEGRQQNPEQKPAEKPKISKTDFFKMLAVAIFFDATLAVIQLIPVAGSVAAMVFNVIPLMLFFIWYLLLGISFSNPKKGLSFFGASLVEFIPIINILPTWTMEVCYMYFLENSAKILGKLAGMTGSAAGLSSFGSKALKMLGAKNVANNLEGVSKNLKETQSNLTNQAQNPRAKVGGEVRPPSIQTQSPRIHLRENQQPNTAKELLTQRPAEEPEPLPWTFGNPELANKTAHERNALDSFDDVQKAA